MSSDVPPGYLLEIAPDAPIPEGWRDRATRIVQAREPNGKPIPGENISVRVIEKEGAAWITDDLVKDMCGLTFGGAHEGAVDSDLGAKPNFKPLWGPHHEARMRHALEEKIDPLVRAAKRRGMERTLFEFTRHPFEPVDHADRFDTCAQCGENIRHDVHLESGESRIAAHRIRQSMEAGDAE